MAEKICVLKGSRLTENIIQPVETEKKEKKKVKTVACEVCEVTEEIRIVLRQCGHVLCLPCILEYIKNRIIVDGHPRFKCPLSTCNEVVHDNDINALLDEKEPALEIYMSTEHRRYLQHKQNKHSIMAALPSSDIKRCPMCRSVYMHEPGCNYVICANSVCNTAFCWHCEKPIGRPCSHYTIASNCRLGYTDYERLFRSVQLALDVNFIILWILLPFVYLIAFLYVPIFIILLVPVSLAYDAYRKEKDSHDFLVPIDIVTIIFRIIIASIIGIVVSIPFAVGSIVSGFIMTFVYMGFLVIRTIPCGLSGDRVGSLLCLMRWVGRIFKIGPYGKLLQEARRERKDALIKLEENQDDFQNEISEFTTPSNTTRTTSTIQEDSACLQSAMGNSKTQDRTICTVAYSETRRRTVADHSCIPSEQQLIYSLLKSFHFLFEKYLRAILDLKMLSEQRFPSLAVTEAGRTSSRGWTKEFGNTGNFKDITEKATIMLSSISPCGGVDELLHDSSELAWRTNKSPPHQAVVTFSQKTEVSYLMLYLDYSKDESYCPQEVRVDIGWSTNDYWHSFYRKVTRPDGWIKIPLLDKDRSPHRVMTLRMTILKNHDKGRDCVVRHFRIIGPSFSRYDSINRVILGASGVLVAKPTAEKTKKLVMNHYLSFR